MTGWINRHNNGISTRTVYFNGKAWNDHRITDGPNTGHHFVSVKPDASRYWPQTFGRRFPNGRR
jgi:hypothetical protein